jgi:hypothetical protein
MLSLASYAGVKVIVLDAVLRELRAHWIRDFDKSLLEAQRKLANLERLCEAIGATATLVAPSREEILNLYDKTVGEFLKSFDLEPAVVMMRPIEELYEMAIWHRLPFKAKGSGFQDVVICFAVIDHLSQSGSKNAALISRDDALDQAAVSAIAAPRGVDLRVYKELRDCEVVLMDEQVGKVKARWEEDRKNALAALEASGPLLTDFLRLNLQIPENIGLFEGTIVGVNDLDIIKIVKVDTPLNKDVSLPVKFSAEIAIRVRALVKPSTLLRPEPKTLRVGDKPKPSNPLAGNFYTFGSGSSPREESLDYAVDIELEASLQNGAYTDLKPLSAKLAQQASYFMSN